MNLKAFKSKKECINHIRKNDVDLAEVDNEKLENMIFKHHNTYALNPYGKFQLAKYYESFLFPFECRNMKEKILLNRLVKVPYHYCNKANELTLFDSEVSFLVKLSGDFSTWLENEASMKVK